MNENDKKSILRLQIYIKFPQTFYYSKISQFVLVIISNK
jgi:hypothetical protein